MKQLSALVLLLSLLGAVVSNPVDTFLSETHADPDWNGTIWAVLVAGSNGYFNYRHQADICHSYQVLTEHGIPEKNIVVLMYDDIANSEENPTPGIIINKPGGDDVYKGVPKDFKGEEVTPENFLKVLQGDQDLAAQGKKVVNSGPNDHIFVYFADHGAPGLIAFPSSELMATDLNNALKKMHQQNRYEKMVLYIEACESGSMFDGLLPNNLKIFATTAANPTESSYACYYDDLRETYLGDVYSVNWIEDSDKRKSLTRETLSSQFDIVKKETNTSHVLEFGDLTMGSLHVSLFQGPKTMTKNVTNCARTRITDAVPSHDVPLMIATKKMKAARTEEQRETLEQEYSALVNSRLFMVDAMKGLTRRMSALGQIPFETLWFTKQTIQSHACYQNLLETFDAHCFDLSTHPYALRYLYVLVNICENVNAVDTAHAIDEMKESIHGHCVEHVSGHPFKRIY